MEEIFLQDYANNVAQAQDPFGIAAVRSQPGFENYVPSFVNQDLAPMGLVDDNPNRLPELKELAKNAAINKAKNYAIKRIGLDGIKGNILSSVMGSNPYTQGLATLGSVLSGNSFNISNILAQKRAEKSYAMNQKRIENELNKSQIQAIQSRLNSQPVPPQDSGRGQIASTSTPTPSAPAARHTSGPGGLHSGY